MISSLTSWFAGRLPDEWFVEPPQITSDRDEILVVGRLAEPEVKDATAYRGRIKRFREDTREERMKIADEAEHRTGRKVSWGATCGDEREVFTNLSVPMMTRLRLPERQVLDTLVGAGVARSRSDALSWCVKLVREHQGDWIDQLRNALVAVEEARGAGPTPN
jgi:hypothetical protein